MAEPPRTSELLRAIAALGAPRLSVAELTDSLGDRAFGAFLLALAALNFIPSPPGTSGVLGVAMMGLAGQIMLGRHRPWLPGILRRRSVVRTDFGRAVGRIAPVLVRLERISRPRLTWLTNGVAERLLGLLVLALAAVIALPIPFVGNLPPAIAVIVISVGFLERDGVTVLMGAGLGLAAVAFTATLAAAAAAGLLNGLHALR